MLHDWSSPQTEVHHCQNCTSWHHYYKLTRSN